MKHWLELNDYVLTYPIALSILEEGMLIFYLKDLKVAEMIHLRSRIENGDPLLLCTDYQNGGPLVIERLIHSTVRITSYHRQIYTLQIRTCLLSQSSPLLRFASISHQLHGTRFPSD